MIKSTKNISKIQNLKKEYITGTIDKNGNSIFNSLDYLIKNHNMSSSTVYRYSSAENWKTKRKSYIDRTHKLYLSNTLVKNQMNEIITIILIKAKKMLEDKNLNSDDLFVLTETVKMCKENFKGLNDD
tara:strand:+ start:296 stop:679 length:384 start_codon:yes stop_codon:yes gene_type:complete